MERHFRFYFILSNQDREELTLSIFNVRRVIPFGCVFQPRCLTSSAAGDECSSWLSMGLSGPWELQLPAMQVSFFKAHQRQGECSPISHHPPTVRRQLLKRLNPVISVNTGKIAVLMIHTHTQ